MSDEREILLVKNIDPSKFSLAPPKPYKSGKGKKATILYNGKSLQLQLPKMRSTNGIYLYEDETGKKSYSTSLSLRDWENTPKFKKLKESVEDHLDQLIIDSCFEGNWISLFSKQKQKDGTVIKAKSPREMFESNYKSGIHIPTDKETGELLNYPPSIKITFPYYDGKFSCALYNEKKEKISQEEMFDMHLKGGIFTPFIRGQVWIVGSNYGIKWELIQATVKENIQRFTECAIQAESDDEDPVDEITDDMAKSKVTTSKVTTDINDSDEEVEDNSNDNSDEESDDDV